MDQVAIAIKQTLETIAYADLSPVSRILPLVISLSNILSVLAPTELVG